MDEETDDDLIQRAATGDAEAMTRLVDRHRGKLIRMVQLRLDQRLQGRLDASDIVQDATMEACRRFEEYAKNPPMEFYLWLRWIAGDKLIDAHRHHLGVQKRTLKNEVSIYRRPLPEVTSAALVDQLVGRITSPTESAKRSELQLAVQAVLNELSAIDREILILRQFEHLTNDETAEVLGLRKSTASKRYIQALKRFRQVLEQNPLWKEAFGYA